MYTPGALNFEDARNRFSRAEISRPGFTAYDVRFVRHTFVTTWKLMFTYDGGGVTFMEKHVINSIRSIIQDDLPKGWALMRSYMEVPRKRQRIIVAEIDVRTVGVIQILAWKGRLLRPHLFTCVER